MSLSVYYTLKLEEPLSQEEMDEIATAWSNAFKGKPYESWGWYELQEAKDGYVHSGATKMPNGTNAAWKAIQIAVNILSFVRNQAGGSDWSVRLDDYEIAWDEGTQSFDPSRQG